jgi:catalase (peroxidase I)
MPYMPYDASCWQDPKTAEWVQIYAGNSPRFFKDFAAAYGKLLALGTAPESAAAQSARASERTRRDAADTALAADMATAITTTSAMASSF